MIVICKSRPDIHMQKAVETYEFRVFRRAMLAADGTMLLPAKRALMYILEKLPSSTNECRSDSQEGCPEQRMRVSVLDVMAEA